MSPVVASMYCSPHPAALHIAPAARLREFCLYDFAHGEIITIGSVRRHANYEASPGGVFAGFGGSGGRTASYTPLLESQKIFGIALLTNPNRHQKSNSVWGIGLLTGFCRLVVNMRSSSTRSVVKTR